MAQDCISILSKQADGGNLSRHPMGTGKTKRVILFLVGLMFCNTCVVYWHIMVRGARVIVTTKVTTATATAKPTTADANRTSTNFSLVASPTATPFKVEWIHDRIPKVIWMYWNSGWPTKSLYAQLALTSFAFTNPTYKIRALNQSQAEMLTNRSQHVPDQVWNNLTIQAQSDIYRTMLLYQYGGIWGDASLFCNMPLDSWLPNATVDSPDLYSFQRTSDMFPKQVRMNLRPWITSWFLVAPPHAPTLNLLFQKIIANASQHGRYSSEYYWWHRAVAELSAEHTNVRDNIMNHMGDSAPSHCRASGWERIAPVIKRCANKDMMTVLPTAMRCCGYQSQQHQQKYYRQKWRRFCGEYRCKGTVAEWDAFCQTNWTCDAHAVNKPGAEYAKHALYGENAAARMKDYFFGAIQ